MRRAALFSGLALLLCTACHRRGEPNPDIRMAISHERVEDSAESQPSSQATGGEGGGDAGGGAGPAQTVPTRLEVPPEVARAWSGIRLGWTDKSNGKSGTLDVPLGEGAPLPDPNLVVRADVFLPAFTMGAGAITSEGVEPQNPAARITVFQKGQEIFSGWIFTRFPDVHPFTHPRFQLRLEGGVPRAPK